MTSRSSHALHAVRALSPKERNDVITQLIEEMSPEDITVALKEVKLSREVDEVAMRLTGSFEGWMPQSH